VNYKSKDEDRSRTT